MNKTVKTFALSAMSVALLSGCILDDKYDGPSSGGGGGGAPNITTTVNVYGWDHMNAQNHEDIELYRIDSNNQQVKIDRESVKGGEGTSIETDEYDPDGKGWQTDDALHVAISEEGGSILVQSNRFWDYSNTANGARYGEGVVRATIYPLSAPLGDNRIFAEIPGSKLDITDIYNAISGNGASEARINIPYSCFPDFNADNLKSTNTPLKISSDSSLEFAIEEITIRSNYFARDQYSVDCNLDHDIAPDNMFSMVDSTLENAEGWATSLFPQNLPGATGGGYTGATVNIEGEDYHGVQVTFGGNSTGGIHFEAPELVSEDDAEGTPVFKDLSTHVAHSTISFDLIIGRTDEDIEDKALQFRVRATGEQLEHHFDTDDVDNPTSDTNLDGSHANYVESVYATDFSEWTQFTIEEGNIGKVIPMTISVADLFNNDNGANLPRRINRLTVQGDGGRGNDYQGMTFHISNLKFSAK